RDTLVRSPAGRGFHFSLPAVHRPPPDLPDDLPPPATGPVPRVDLDGDIWQTRCLSLAAGAGRRSASDRRPEATELAVGEGFDQPSATDAPLEPWTASVRTGLPLPPMPAGPV